MATVVRNWLATSTSLSYRLNNANSLLLAIQSKTAHF